MKNKSTGKRIFALLVSVGVAFMGFAIVPAGATSENEMESTSIESRVSEASAAIPQGSYRINVNMNGRSVLSGQVFNKNGITYVPMRAFADWLGQYTHSLSYVTSTATLTGTSLKVSARAGDRYIYANDRYFYTGEPIIMWNNVIYVPILAMVKALNAHMEWRQAENCFYIRSGDSRLLKTGARVYRADEVFWLARIISAEAQGEPIAGKIAVGNVVLNRVASVSYPNTIYGVIFDKKYGIQFSPVANGTIYNNPTEESIIAAKICLEGYSLSREILYFVNPTVAPNSWIAQNRPYVFTIESHAFFK